MRYRHVLRSDVPNIFPASPVFDLSARIDRTMRVMRRHPGPCKNIPDPVFEPNAAPADLSSRFSPPFRCGPESLLCFKVMRRKTFTLCPKKCAESGPNTSEDSSKPVADFGTQNALSENSLEGGLVRA